MGCADVRQRELFPSSASELFLGVSVGFFVFFFVFLDSFSQLSYTTQSFEPEQQGHRISREEKGLPLLPCAWWMRSG